jgi:uncharacterized SAM-binding protein YcdF (DUF218 family)
MPSLKEQRRWRWRRWVALLALAAAVWLSRAYWLRGIGEFLVRAEEPQRADAIAVLAGDGNGLRLLKALDLVRQGFAPLILITGPYAAYGNNEADMAIDWAVRRGASKEILAPVRMRARSTVAEVQNLNPELGRRGLKKVVVVTSNFHTRRARAVLNRYGLPGVQFIVVASPDEDFDPKDWWHSREAKKVVLLEYAKLVNWWIE